MISVSRKLFCAVEAVLLIAGGGGAQPVSSKAVSERLGVAPRYLEQMMQKLVHAGILRGVRGPRGGYVLARERRRITLDDIRRVLQEEDDLPAPAVNGHRLSSIAGELEKTVAAKLAGVTIADLCGQEAKRAEKTPEARRMDFTI